MHDGPPAPGTSTTPGAQSPVPLILTLGLRLAVWLCLLILLACLTAGGWLVFESQRPEPGANMALMGLPAVAMLAIAVSLPVVAIAVTARKHLRNWEWITYTGAGLLGLAPAVCLVVLG